MTSKTLASRIIGGYDDIHLYGKIVSAGIFATHGIIDFTTTAIGRQMASNRGVEFAQIESNALIAGTSMTEMAVILLVSAFVMGLAPIGLHYMNARIGDNHKLNRVMIDGLFTLLLMGGIYININNILFLLNF